MIFNNLNWQSVPFGCISPYYQVSEILDRNFGAICGHFESEYFTEQAKNGKYILPKLSRMTNEHRKTNSEHSTKNREVSSFGMVHGANTNPFTVTKGFKTRSIQTTDDMYDNGHESGTRKSAFVPVGCHTSHIMTNNGLLNNLKLGEKRKLQSFTSGNFSSEDGKRFKSDELTESTYKRNALFNELKQPFSYGDNSVYCNRYFQQNSSSLNRITKDVSRKLDFNFNTTSNDMPKHLFQVKPERMRISQKDLENNLTRVGEAESIRHGDPSVSQNSQETRSFEANNSGEFISLDSTRTSFLTQIKKLRQKAECNAMPMLCPFCSQTFLKYPELKIHVQSHKYTNISGIKTDQLNQQPDSTNDNDVLTSVSSLVTHGQHLPSRRLSTGDDGVTRATSVIQFAEKKNKEV